MVCRPQAAGQRCDGKTPDLATPSRGTSITKTESAVVDPAPAVYHTSEEVLRGPAQRPGRLCITREGVCILNLWERVLCGRR